MSAIMLRGGRIFFSFVPLLAIVMKNILDQKGENERNWELSTHPSATHPGRRQPFTGRSG
ncbi:hypothetical protein [Rhizobium sp. N122]|uniref:hypothetical protein n=1 Tax=Rhizobium sp. N122 TaxID=1764272 RepID=UPI00167D6C9D|nr:hypothetical protein [Rhizobium sp. N122]